MGRNVDDEPGKLHADDLALASACVAGDRKALARFEREHLVPLAATLRRAGYEAALVDDAIQLVRYRLLVATPEREAKLATYRGRGSLAGWLRVTATRQARALLDRRAVTFDDSREAVATGASLETAMVVREHGARLRDIVRAAIGQLDAQPREALRLELVEGLPHHAIAKHFAVHRTTVVRWIEDARGAIAASVRRALRKELDLGAATIESLLPALTGVDISLASAFRAGG